MSFGDDLRGQRGEGTALQGVGAVARLRPPAHRSLCGLPPCPSGFPEMSSPQRAHHPALLSYLSSVLPVRHSPTLQTLVIKAGLVPSISLRGEAKPSPKPVRPPHSPVSPPQPPGPPSSALCPECFPPEDLQLAAPSLSCRPSGRPSFTCTSAPELSLCRTVNAGGHTREGCWHGGILAGVWEHGFQEAAPRCPRYK